MANQQEKITLGIDVAKAELVILEWQTQSHSRLDNEPAAIEAWLDALQAPVRIAIESTSDYHLALVDAAVARGHQVYVVNTRQLAHYRIAVNVRNKTDPDDAYLLARYLTHEAAQLRLYKPQNRKARLLWKLLKGRARVVGARKQLKQSLDGIELPTKAMYNQLDALLGRFDKHIETTIEQLNWKDDYQRCLSVPGFGRLNAAAMVCAYHRGTFAGSDAFIAYFGLDVRVRESGQSKGRSKLSKNGETELRRLAYCAARPSRSYPPFDQYHQRQLDKGMSKIAANVILARKLVRIGFALMQNQTMFKKEPKEPCYSP